MKRFVHRRVISGVIGDEPVFLEAPPHIIGIGGKGDINTPAKVAKHRTAIALDGGNHLHLPTMMQLSAVNSGLQHSRQIIHATRRKLKSAGCWRESGGVGYRGHLNGALGAVEEGVEHLRIKVAARYCFWRKTVVTPDSVGR